MQGATFHFQDDFRECTTSPGFPEGGDATVATAERRHHGQRHDQRSGERRGVLVFMAVVQVMLGSRFWFVMFCCYVVLKGKGGNTGRSSREFVLVFSSLPVPDLFSFQPRWTVAICRPRFRRVSPQAAGADKCDVQCRS